MYRLMTALLLAAAAGAWSPAAAGGGVPAGHGGPVRSAALSADGALLLTGGFDNRLVLWDTATARPLSARTAQDAAVAFLALTRDEGLAFSVGDDGTLARWRLPGLSRAGATIDVGKPAAMALDPSGRTLALALWDGGIELRRAGDGSLLSPAEGGGPRSTSLLFLDPDTLLGGTAPGFLEQHRLDLPAAPLRVRAHDFAITDLALLADGRLASASVDGRVRLWRLPDLEPAGQLEGGNRPVLSLAAAPQGDLLASGDADGRIVLWRLSDGTGTRVLDAHDGAVFDLAFGPGRRLWSAGGDGAVRVWQGPGFTGETAGGPPPPGEPPPAPGHERGRELFRTCIACHSLSPDGGSRAGPSLYRLYGRRAGSLESYAYSPALARSEIVWTEETLARLFELGPDRYTPGSKMPLQRMPRAVDRTALAAYLRVVTGGGDRPGKERDR